METYEARFREAEAAFTRQDWATANLHLQHAIAIDPGRCAAHVLSSYADSYLGHYRSARTHALAAAGCRQEDLENTRDVMSRLRTFNEAEALLRFVDRLGPPSRLPIRLLLECANQLSLLNLQEQARVYLEEAYRADPLYPPTLVSLGQVLLYLGDFERANGLLAQGLQRAPGIAQTYWLAALLGNKRDRGIDV